MKLDQPISQLKGVGVVVAKKLSILGVHNVEDLLENYPRRYDDYSNILDISQIKPGIVTVKAEIKQIKGRYVRRGLHITEAVASDATGSVRLLWFNQPYRATTLKTKGEYFVSGQFELSHQRLAIMNPSVELVSDFPVSTARIVPIYRETKGFKSFQVRKLVREVLQDIDLAETIPGWLLEMHHLIPRLQAITTMHFPESMTTLEQAQTRLGFEEVFELTLAALLNKYELNKEQALSIPFDKKLAQEFSASLPFKLTDAQRMTVWRIYQDLQKTTPMNRLIEGDVGSGKTVVAAMAAVMAIHDGYQVAMMAPTELLARQHANTIHHLLKPLELDGQVGLLVGSLKPAQKQVAHKKIKTGAIRFIIGTHALISEKVDMHNLGLVIIDEQHRFGVEQRKKLQAKAGHMPHVLHLTATPIPRSLALTLYGELDVTILDSKPLGRKEIITKICSPNSRDALYKKIDQELENGHQMFVVCPLITESEIVAAHSAEKTYVHLKNNEFKHRRVGLLHGKMKSKDKTTVMEQFINGKLDILVATTVVEVGVDVPNATVMLIEGTDRFGLAQIHQLRGRVGRSEHQGYCYLMMSDSSVPSRRLRALEQSNDGFKLAELDLEIRGPGAIYGQAQHGQLDLRVAKLTDIKLIAAARASAQQFIDNGENLLQYPHLSKRVQQLRTITNLN